MAGQSGPAGRTWHCQPARGHQGGLGRAWAGGTYHSIRVLGRSHSPPLITGRAGGGQGKCTLSHTGLVQTSLHRLQHSSDLEEQVEADGWIDRGRVGPALPCLARQLHCCDALIPPDSVGHRKACRIRSLAFSNCPNVCCLKQCPLVSLPVCLAVFFAALYNYHQLVFCLFP